MIAQLSHKAAESAFECSSLAGGKKSVVVTAASDVFCSEGRLRGIGGVAAANRAPRAAAAAAAAAAATAAAAAYCSSAAAGRAHMMARWPGSPRSPPRRTARIRLNSFNLDWQLLPRHRNVNPDTNMRLLDTATVSAVVRECPCRVTKC